MPNRTFHGRGGLSLDLMVQAFAQRYRLTERETQIVGLMAGGATGTEGMAAQLGVSPNTVSNQLKSIFDKVGAPSKSGVLAMLVGFLARHSEKPSVVERVPRVLVVDDQPEIGDLVDSLLTDAGCRVRVAKSVDDALSLMPVFSPDVVMTDMRMPGRDGRALIEDVRRVTPYAPRFVVMSAFSDYSTEYLYQMGVSVVLPKPFTMESCVAAVSRAVMDDVILSESAPDTMASEIPRSHWFEVETRHVGYGGVFVPAEPARLVQMGVGSVVRVEFDIGASRRVVSTGDVVWVRSGGDANVTSGLGVRFWRMTREDRIALEDHVLAGSIRDFIPTGRRSS